MTTRGLGTGEDRTLIHYLCVKPEVHYQNIGLALLKIIMSQHEYCNHKVMAVASLHSSYLGAV